MADCFVFAPASAIACALGVQCGCSQGKENETERGEGSKPVISPFQKPIVASKAEQYRQWEPEFYRGNDPRSANQKDVGDSAGAEVTPLLAHHVRFLLTCIDHCVV